MAALTSRVYVKLGSASTMAKIFFPSLSPSVMSHIFSKTAEEREGIFFVLCLPPCVGETGKT